MRNCFQLDRLAQKTLRDLEWNLSSSAWVQVTPELCSSFYFCISFRPSPRSLHHPCTPVAAFLQHLSNMLDASEVSVHTVPATIRSHTCPSIPTADETESRGAQEASSNPLLVREGPLSNLSRPDPSTERRSLCWGPATWLLAPLTFNTEGALRRIQESFLDLALMSLLSS